MDELVPLPGQRVIVCGPSCSGKSTLAARLGETLGLPFIELDALFWRPNWKEPTEEEFAAQIDEATAGDRWVVAGNYVRHMTPIAWPRADTIIWLDLGLPLVTWRVLRRSWRRWRTNELLWGTNYERFFPQLKLWDKNSLITFNVTHHRSRRARYAAAMEDPQWAHIAFVRLRSPQAVEAFLAGLQPAYGRGVR
jgi:adenylate kinase family enzyme